MPSSQMHELDAEAEHFDTPCGAGTMAWRRWGDPALNRPRVVLLHGGSGSWNHWIRTIPALRNDYEVWALDIPGLGDSAMPADPPTPQTCADAIVTGFRQFFSSERKAHMVGFSFGCHVGTLAARELNDHLTGIIITGCAALGLQRPPMRPFPKERSGMTEAERREVHRGVLEILMFSDPARIDEEAIDLQTVNIEKARFRSRGFADSTDIKDGLAHVHVPLKTIWGRNDTIARPNVETCLDLLRIHHPELEHRIIEDSGHWVMYEQAEAYNRALLDLLDSAD
jgi:2-hydroxy-6-oxonona-2,4-dienedioate hydrolase